MKTLLRSAIASALILPLASLASAQLLNRQGPTTKSAAAAPEAPPAAPTLSIGSPAPTLSIASWPKGDKIDAFKKSDLYVVLFWGTYDAQSLQLVDDMTRLQARTKDKGLHVVAVTSEPRVETAVEGFLKRAGDRVGYSIAIDNEKTTFKAYIGAAGLRGIPLAFVIDRDGTIAWAGHPNNGLNEVVDLILAGKFDAMKHKAQDRDVDLLEQQLDAAANGQDWDGALRVLDEIAVIRPSLAARVAVQRFTIVYQYKHQFDAGNTLALSLIAGELKDNDDALRQIARTILVTNDNPSPRLDIALRAAERAIEITGGQQATALSITANIYQKLGDLDKAVDFQRRAYENCVEDPMLQNRLGAGLNELLGKRDAARKPQDPAPASPSPK